MFMSGAGDRLPPTDVGLWEIPRGPRSRTFLSTSLPNKNLPRAPASHHTEIRQTRLLSGATGFLQGWHQLGIIPLPTPLPTWEGSALPLKRAVLWASVQRSPLVRGSQGSSCKIS